MIFNPVDILERLLRLDKAAAGALFAGLGVAASVPILRAWDVDPQTSLSIVAFLLCCAIALKVVALMFGPTPEFRLHRIVLGWLLIAIIALPILSMLTSSILGSSSPFSPVYCQVQFYRNCNDVEEEITEQREARRRRATNDIKSSTGSFDLGLMRQANAAPLARLHVVDTTVLFIQQRTDTRSQEMALRRGPVVFVQFAGLIARDRMRAFNRELSGLGWRLPEAERGGERTQSAAGVNEVRYGDVRDRDAANLLAKDVNAITPGNQLTVVRRNPTIGAGKLEVWVSR